MADLRREILDALNDPRVDAAWGRHNFANDIALRTGVSVGKVTEELWRLAGEGLVYVDPNVPYESAAYWRWTLSEHGRQAARGGLEPHDPQGFLRTLFTAVPHLDEAVVTYTAEALRAFNARCYLSTSVMLGVASERAFLLLAEAFAQWLPDGEREGYVKRLGSARNHVSKFVEFRKRLEPRKPTLPRDLSESLTLDLDAVLDLLRATRNDAGHPTGRAVERDTAYVHLQLFGIYVQKLWRLREFFLA